MSKEKDELVSEEEIKETTSTETEEAEAVEVEVSELDLAKEQLAQMEDQYLRAQAEIVNMRNRHNKEREDAAKYRAQDLAKELLSAIDNLDRALEIEVSDEHGQSLKKGIEMVRESLLYAFKQSGVEEIPAMGEIFDPNLHQAVQTLPIEGDQKSDEIIQVLQKGYKLHDRILRPAMVVVAQ